MKIFSKIFGKKNSNEQLNKDDLEELKRTIDNIQFVLDISNSVYNDAVQHGDDDLVDMMKIKIKKEEQKLNAYKKRLA